MTIPGDPFDPLAKAAEKEETPSVEDNLSSLDASDVVGTVGDVVSSSASEGALEAIGNAICTILGAIGDL